MTIVEAAENFEKEIEKALANVGIIPAIGELGVRETIVQEPLPFIEFPSSTQLLGTRALHSRVLARRREILLEFRDGYRLAKHASDSYAPPVV